MTSSPPVKPIVSTEVFGAYALIAGPMDPRVGAQAVTLDTNVVIPTLFWLRGRAKLDANLAALWLRIKECGLRVAVDSALLEMEYTSKAPSMEQLKANLAHLLLVSGWTKAELTAEVEVKSSRPADVSRLKPPHQKWLIDRFEGTANHRTFREHLDQRLEYAIGLLHLYRVQRDLPPVTSAEVRAAAYLTWLEATSEDTRANPPGILRHVAACLFLQISWTGVTKARGEVDSTNAAKLCKVFTKEFAQDPRKGSLNAAGDILIMQASLVVNNTRNDSVFATADNALAALANQLMEAVVVDHKTGSRALVFNASDLKCAVRSVPEGLQSALVDGVSLGRQPSQRGVTAQCVSETFEKLATRVAEGG